MPTEKRATPKSWFEILELLEKADLLPPRILLYGPKATGKSSWPLYRWKDKCERVQVTQGTGVEDIIGQWGLTAGKTVWLDGPAVRAMSEGRPLLLDELDRYSPEVESLLQAVLDDPAIASLGLPDGRTIKPAPGYRVIATMNQPPACLNSAIQDRFDVVLHCAIPSPGALGTIKDPKSRKALLNQLANSGAPNQWNPDVTLRRVVAYERLVEVFDDQTSALLAFGQRGPEWLSVIGS